MFTNAQTTAFFKNTNQMVIPHATVINLAKEGIANCSDLAEFYDVTIKLIADNLKKPGGQVTDPNYSKATIATPPFVFGAKFQQRLNIACHLVRYYKMVGRPLMASNLQWSCTMSRRQLGRPPMLPPSHPFNVRKMVVLRFLRLYRNTLATKSRNLN